MEKSLLEQALKYAEFGFFIFPCRYKHAGKILSKKGKWIELKPKQPLIQKGVLSATKDLKQIEIWWKRWPNAMIGTNLGMSNRFVIDIDNHKVNGLDNWHSLGISDEGCQHVMTPSGGLHLYFSGQGRASTNEKLGIDTRGGDTYTLLPNSFVEDLEGNRKFYVALDDMFIEPRELTNDVIEKLGLVRKPKQDRGSYVSNLTLDEELQKAKKVIWKMPFDVIDNYDSWLHVALYLRKFGDSGKQVWLQWTDEKYLSVNPNSKRATDLEYKWDSIQDKKEDVTLGTLYYYLKAYKDENHGTLMVDI